MASYVIQTYVKNGIGCMTVLSMTTTHLSGFLQVAMITFIIIEGLLPNSLIDIFGGIL